MSDARPKVLMIGGDGRPSGVPRHIRQLAAALKKDAQITVISDRDEGGYSDLDAYGARHVVVDGLRNRPSLTHIWRGITGLRRAIDHEAPDLIWVHARLPSLLARLTLALRLWHPECPVVFTHHGLPYGRGYHPLVDRICRRVERLLLATCPPQDIVFLNHRMAGLMARDTQATRLARHRVHVLPNCSDLAPLPPRRRPNRRTLVMTGRTGRQKDYGFAANVFSHLPPHFDLTLCGPGTEDPAFQRHIASLVPANVFSRITFTGPLSDVRWVLRRADAYLLTSRYEGTPIGALEAFEAGLPIILRDFDGASDLVAKHPCGLLIGKGEISEDARNITALIDRYQAQEEILKPRIKAVWAANWSPDIFALNARALVRSIHARRAACLPIPTGSLRDGPTPHPDPSRNRVGLPPAPPPYHTDVSPSAESG